MITQEKIEKNKIRFIKAITEHNICSLDLISKLDEGGSLFLSPATTSKSMYNAFPGGLVDHLLRVASYAIKINDLLPENLRYSKQSLLRVSFVHGFGKAGLFKLNNNDWQVANLGKIYDFIDDKIAMSIGERSIYYVLTKEYCENLFSDAEFQAIINHDKDLSEDKQAKWHTNGLGIILRQAIDLAIIEEKAMV